LLQIILIMFVFDYEIVDTAALFIYTVCCMMVLYLQAANSFHVSDNKYHLHMRYHAFLHCDSFFRSVTLYNEIPFT